MSEQVGIDILKGLGTGLDNQYWKNNIFEKTSKLMENLLNKLNLVGIKIPITTGVATVGVSAIPRT